MLMGRPWHAAASSTIITRRLHTRSRTRTDSLADRAPIDPIDPEFHIVENRSGPFFSLVVPTFNRARLIRRTLESIVNQEDPDFEVLVIDDGGTDETAEIVRTIGDDRIRYFWKPNGERGAARNTGTLEARGRYVTFCDSDDVLYPHHLGTARELIASRGTPEFLHLPYERRDENGSLIGKSLKLQGSLNEMLPSGNLLSCHGVFLRRDVALEVPFNENRDLSGSEDWELWLRLAARYPIHYHTRATSALIDHPERSVLAFDEAKLLNRKKLLIQYLDADAIFVARMGHCRPRIEHEFDSYIGLHLALAGQPWRASRYLIRCIRERPFSILERRSLATIKYMLRGSVRRLLPGSESGTKQSAREDKLHSDL